MKRTKSPKVHEWISEASSELRSAGIESAQLDAELILAFVLDISRTELLIRSNQLIDQQISTKATGYLDRRLKREPLAYIRGFVEFYGLTFLVDRDVLIPRSESELIIDIVVKEAPINASLLDVGTGSGALAITIKNQRPDLKVYASDISPAALKIARQNAKQLNCDINFIKSNILEQAPNTDIVVANLPYVRKDQTRSPETEYEPPLALFAEDDGLALYKKLFNQLPKSCKILVIECESEQMKILSDFARNFGFKYLQNSDFICTFQRI